MLGKSNEVRMRLNMGWIGLVVSPIGICDCDIR